MLPAHAVATHGKNPPFLVAPNLPLDGLPHSLAARSGDTPAGYFEYVDDALQQLLGASFVARASATSGGLHAIRFTPNTGLFDLNVSVSVFCPDDDRRPSAEETVVFVETAQTQLFSFDRLCGPRRDYNLRNRLDDAGGSLPKQIASVVNMFYREQFALCSLTSFIGIRIENDYWVTLQMDFYLPHQVGGLLASIRWQEKHK